MNNIDHQHQRYQQIADIEQKFALADNNGDALNFNDYIAYKFVYFSVLEHQRFFQNMITYKFHERPETQEEFFNFCALFGQKQIYNRYMPNYFPNLMRHWINTKADYRQWGNMLYWLMLNYRIFDDKIANFNVLGIHFIASVSILNYTPEKQHFLDALINHLIYRQALHYYNDFVVDATMDNVNKIHKICFDHIVKVRQSGNFDHDPWINFYNHYQYDPEYQAYMAPHYHYMDTHNIEYRDKLIFGFFIDKNIGDVFFFTQAMIHWSRQHNIPLIAMLTPFQAQWISVYFKDDIDAIIIRDKDVKPPFMMRFLYPAKGRAIILRHPTEDMPPYYFPRSQKRHYNYYTHDGLYDVHADIGEPIPISPIPDHIKNSHNAFFRKNNFNPTNIIFMSLDSHSNNGTTGSNIILLNFWQKLIDALKNAQYIPIINLSSADQKPPIKNVMSVYLPLSHVVDFTNRVGGFIGVRSGFCDLLCASDNPKKYCVYPIDYDNHCNDLAPWYYLVHFKFESLDKHINDIITSLNGEYVPALENHQCYGSSQIPNYCPSS